MARIATVDLARRIKKLRTQRDRLAAEIGRIDTTLRQIAQALGSALAAPAPEADAPRAGRRGGRRRRGSFGISGLESILAYVKQSGQPTTADINTHWKSEGRAGRADVVIGKLVAEKKLKRLAMKEGRGSRYALA